MTSCAHPRRRQHHVNSRQGRVKTAGRQLRNVLTDRVIENLTAAVIGVALLAYLVYALVRPEKF